MTEPTELIRFPCRFPIKVMITNDTAVRAKVIAVAQAHEPALTGVALVKNLVERPSKAGNYLSMTFELHTTSRAHLDDIYRAFYAIEGVKYLL